MYTIGEFVAVGNAKQSDSMAAYRMDQKMCRNSCTSSGSYDALKRHHDPEFSIRVTSARDIYGIVKHFETRELRVINMRMCVKVRFIREGKSRRCTTRGNNMKWGIAKEV
jgi:hypothetical protein